MQDHDVEVEACRDDDDDNNDDTSNNNTDVVNNAELLPVEEANSLSEDKDTVSSRKGLSPDEKRAGLIVLGCFLFQEVDSSVFRAVFVASLAAYALSRCYVACREGEESGKLLEKAD
ncbi:hypothetical protein DQ04_01601100 [Trypanosoma grayi]|uniref:hypothetical protein n=1 Tax=Trypanosoma grayi TaxID=71804 RepID=UPI0004F451AD|nr:hypothetical protein DQ04_01601100 [Trypanosoma grayi]KEG12585.1 hypothetical protein DQ04_01601100 [Trypanosoma grayi]